MNSAVVYFHLKAATDEVFYVGIGIGFRPYRTSGRSQLWNRVVEKYGFTVKVIEENLTWERAKEREMFYIKQFGRLDKRTGVLVNHTDGGDGTLGGIHNVGSKRTDESKLRISIALKGRKINPEVVKKSVEARKRNFEERQRLGVVKPKRVLSDAELLRVRTMNIGRKHTEEFKKAQSDRIRGRVCSEEHKRKVSEAKKGVRVPEERRKRISETLISLNAMNLGNY